mgnify:CR=1 FL=1
MGAGGPGGWFDSYSMSGTSRSILSLLTIAMLAGSLPAAQAAKSPTPDWVKPALRYLAENDFYERDAFFPNRPMARADFKKLMSGVE